MIKERLGKLREVMKQEGVQCLVIPTSDYHNSEYVSDYFMARRYFSGFTGSAGTLVVAEDQADFLRMDAILSRQPESFLAVISH